MRGDPLENRVVQGEIVIFGDERIVNAPVETWPKVDALISFYSDGFPLQKVEQYVRTHKPFGRE